MSVWHKLRKEIKTVALATLYFAAWIGVLMVLKVLVLEEYQIEFRRWSLVLVGALVLAKVVLVLEHVPLGTWIQTRSAWVDLILRTGLYALGVFVVLVLEKAFEGRHEHGGFAPAVGSVFQRAEAPHVWSNMSGQSLAIEHNGDVYACDHCVYPQHRLGNILTDALPAMVQKSLKSGFGISKETALPRWCGECEVLPACHGGCLKHRFETTYYDEPGLQYLCAGYKKFFMHIRKYLRAMATLLEHGLPASRVMDAIKGPLVIRQ